jgi:hypothetical protein
MYCDGPTLCDVYIMRYGTLTICDATLCDFYVVLYYVLSQYHEDKQKGSNNKRKRLHAFVAKLQ